MNSATPDQETLPAKAELSAPPGVGCSDLLCGTVKYRTIVADPPWDHSDGTGATLGEDGWEKSDGCPYKMMSIEEIKALPVKQVAEADKWHVNGDRGGCNLFLWTTTRYLLSGDACEVARAWGFVPTKILTWCKPPMGFGMGGTFKSNLEFVIVARRGSPPRATGSEPTSWFNWPRGKHSAKPEAFTDMIERVSVGPYLELFARRQRLGWHTWGNEALNHITLVPPNDQAHLPPGGGGGEAHEEQSNENTL